MNSSERIEDSFSCAYCGVVAHQTKVSLKVLTDNSGNFEPIDLSDEQDAYQLTQWGMFAGELDTTDAWRAYSDESTWWGSICAACRRLTVWRQDERLHPRVTAGIKPPHPEMPDKARELYEEAAAVLPTSRRAAAALARASMEALLKELDGTPGRKNLQDRLGALHSKVSPELWKILTALRVVGNDALHGDDDELVTLYLVEEDSGVVRALFAAINEVVHELVARPREWEELYALIPESKREAAERATQKRQ
ncbi:DUF4145 domain-containing protein [Microbacterium hydrocarbonoxydans]|uniref:DUF4145 domain-containing protein n=1 Tax=Microbacterium hydrocarbonoxydans TaxID=273678 RepID=A0A1H4MK57_9MICO|nr:DUF4145 domain-containing protein [Microbacterium hydrocarbonoxydans]SEB83144.1 protein of unknown function [Microbacterium hydrocarbonoxydans]